MIKKRCITLIQRGAANKKKPTVLFRRKKPYVILREDERSLKKMLATKSNRKNNVCTSWENDKNFHNASYQRSNYGVLCFFLILYFFPVGRNHKIRNFSIFNKNSINFCFLKRYEGSIYVFFNSLIISFYAWYEVHKTMFCVFFVVLKIMLTFYSQHFCTKMTFRLRSVLHMVFFFLKINKRYLFFFYKKRFGFLSFFFWQKKATQNWCHP